jgi:hypothetical protein
MAIRNVATINLQILEATKKKVGKALQAIPTDYELELAEKIRKRTRLGYGVDPDTGNTMRLPKLSDSYKEQRQGKARYYTDKQGRKIRVPKNKNNTDYVKKPRLSRSTKPATSNLTATGQLLKSLTAVKIKFSRGVRFLITVGDNRGRGLYDVPSKIGNKQLVEYLAAQGRTFLGFTRSQRNEISREIRQFIKRFLR